MFTPEKSCSLQSQAFVSQKNRSILVGIIKVSRSRRLLHIGCMHLFFHRREPDKHPFNERARVDMHLYSTTYAN